MKILVTSYPFCKKNKTPLKLLLQKKYKVDADVMLIERKLSVSEIIEKIEDVDAVIAGTEKYDKSILKHAKNLKIISRLGIGLDSIDFNETAKLGIKVAYTPEAPSRAVAELTIGLIISAARKILNADNSIRNKGWKRYVGVDLYHKKIGIIGLGRIGKLVSKFLAPFECSIFVNDIKFDKNFILHNNLIHKNKNWIYRNCDVISLHIPRTEKTENLITKNELKLMKKNCLLINTSRGGIVNEKDLYDFSKNNTDFYSVLDVFNNEPYHGNLTELENIILTPHLGSCSENSRYLMETQAAQNIIDFFEKGFSENIVSG